MRVILELKAEKGYKITQLLKISGMSKSTFYEVKSKLNQPDKDKYIKENIVTLVKKHKQRYGYRKISDRLRIEYNMIVNRKKVYRIMKEMNLLSKFRVKKYKSYRGTIGKIAKNLLKRKFEAKRPNRKWVTDITEFKVKGKKIYLSPLMDLHDRSIISFTRGFSSNVKLVTDMLDQVLTKKRYRRLIIHSDQGFQYQNIRFRRRLKQKKIKQSMSRKGNCLDNAVIENFFGILKSEFYYLEKFDSPEHFIRELDKYIKYYNEERMSTKLKGMTPIEYRHHSLSFN